MNNVTHHFNGKSVTSEDERNTLRDGGTPIRTGTFPFQNHYPGVGGLLPGITTVQIGGPYGLDGYTATDYVKQHLPGEIIWKDRPGMHAGFSTDIPANIISGGYEYNAEFMTTVGGPLGNRDPARECTCRFQVKIDIAGNGTTTTGKLIRVHGIDENRCVL